MAEQRDTDANEQESSADSIQQSISASGKNARITQIANARNVFIQQVGTWWFVAILIAVLGASAFLFFQLRETVPDEMTGDFRIAVAGFEVIGDEEAQDLGAELSQGVFLRLEETFEEIRPDFTVTIWGPDMVGDVSGQDDTERAANAQAIAEGIKADVVVYGLIDASRDLWEISPSFFLADNNLSDAQELTGQHQIGVPFSVAGRDSVIAARINVSNQLSDRARLLALLIEGVAYYSIRDFPLAFEKFTVAAESDAWSEIGGDELVHLLIGNAALKAGDLDRAEEAYERSLEIDEQYARAYAGLGSLAYLRALGPIEKEDGSQVPADVDVALLEESLAYFAEALTAEKQPLLSDISSKVHFGRGQALMMLSFSDPSVAVFPAVLEFEAVIADYGDGANPRIRDLAAEAHARLGLIHAAGGEKDTAIDHYNAAVDLWFDNPEKQRIYRQRLADLGV